MSFSKERVCSIDFRHAALRFDAATRNPDHPDGLHSSPNWVKCTVFGVTVRGTRTKGTLAGSSSRGVAGKPETSEGGWSEVFGHTTSKPSLRCDSGLSALFSTILCKRPLRELQSRVE
jgi:hypothetical protein